MANPIQNWLDFVTFDLDFLPWQLSVLSKALRCRPQLQEDHTVLPATHSWTIPASKWLAGRFVSELDDLYCMELTSNSPCALVPEWITFMYSAIIGQCMRCVHGWWVGCWLSNSGTTMCASTRLVLTRRCTTRCFYASPSFTLWNRQALTCRPSTRLLRTATDTGCTSTPWPLTNCATRRSLWVVFAIKSVRQSAGRSYHVVCLHCPCVTHVHSYIDMLWDCIQGKSKKVKQEYSRLWNFTTQLREIACHMGSHSVTCHPAAADQWLSRLTPAEAGTQFSDPGQMQGWVDLGGGYNTQACLPAEDGHLSQK